MNCPECGYEYWSTEVVCPCCGSILSSQEAHRTQCSPVDVPALTRSAIKDSATSGVFLAAVVSLTLSFLVELFFACKGANFYAWNEILQMMGAVTMDETGPVQLYSILMALVERLPLIVTLIGLWMVFVGATAKGLPGKSALTVVRVGQTIDIACTVLACILIVIVVYIISSEAATILLLSGILPGVATVVILFKVKALGSIITVAESLERGDPESNISMFMCVCGFILGGTTILSGIGELDLPGILTGLASILFSCVALGYRSGMAYVEGEIERQAKVPSQPVQERIPMWKRIQQEQGLDT